MPAADQFERLIFDHISRWSSNRRHVQFQFATHDAHAVRGFDADLYPVATDFDDRDRDVVADAKLFARFAAEN